MHRSDEHSLLQRMHLEGAETMSGIKAEAKVKLEKHDVPGLYQTSVGVMNGEEIRQPIHRRPAGLTIRVREIDCMLADIQAQIQMLRRERTHLGLVREELAGGMEAKLRGSSPCNTSLNQQALRRISGNP
jgi:hypothetical protein